MVIIFRVNDSFISNWLLNGYDDLSPGAYVCANRNENVMVLENIVYLFTNGQGCFTFWNKMAESKVIRNYF